GLGGVCDHGGGRREGVAAALRLGGRAKRGGMFTRRGVATVAEETPAAEALGLLEAQGFSPVLVVNEAGGGMGSAYREGLAAAPGGAAVGAGMRVGVSTRRPSADGAAPAPPVGA